MAGIWGKRFHKALDEKVNDFNSSLRFDCVMFREDIEGSIAHVHMLGKQGIMSVEESNIIAAELASIREDIETGALPFDFHEEDIHIFVERQLTERLRAKGHGDLGKKLHTARSRNDQVAVDVRLYLRARIADIRGYLVRLCRTIVAVAERNSETIMPGYTHLQRAQPICFAEQLLAYCNMFLRDIDRLDDCKRRMNKNPLGSGALAGTSFNIDRGMTAAELGFDGVVANSIDGVSDRDFAIELANCIAISMMHLSRFSEEIILWSSSEFKFIELDDAYSTGSSIMPQKKNPDIAELVRGKTGRCYGNLMALLTVMKGLPLAYNKDMQEDKEAIFDSVDTILQCLPVFTDMLATMTVREDNMSAAAKKGFINATDCADYLTKKGLPFRTAYEITGAIVGDCVTAGITLEDMTLEQYRTYSEYFEEDIYNAIDMRVCLNVRTSEGGPALPSVQKQLSDVKAILDAIDA